MKKEKLIKLARQHDVSPHYLTSHKTTLIKAIQKAQGKDPCYLSDQRYTCVTECPWDDDCKKLTAAWLR